MGLEVVATAEAPGKPAAVFSSASSLLLSDDRLGCLCQWMRLGYRTSL